MSSSQWVELVDPQTNKTFFANTATGDYLWEKPPNISIPPKDPHGEWWELFDQNHQLPYYYNTATAQTEWIRPTEGRIVSLIALQNKAGAPVFALKDPQAAEAPKQPASNKSSLSSNVSPVSGRPSVSAAQQPRLSQSQQQQRTSQSTQQQPPPQLPPQLRDEINQFKIEGFAKKYFSTHKRGIFRKKVPVEKMLVFSKDVIPAPLMKINQALSKDAIKNFKSLQRAMGDKQSKKSNSEDIQDILLSGINHGELRDEIYCQILKQLEQNPKQESVYRGWDVLASVVVTFPPSKNFEMYLTQFLTTNSNHSDQKIRTFAQHCLVRLERISKKGPRGKVPTIAEIDRAKEAPFNPSVFGESLSDIMDTQQREYPDLKLPRIMTFLAEGILALNGCNTEGIFRVPGDADQVTELRIRLEKGKYDLGGISDASVPGSLFKFWLRDLTDPLVPHELYQYCITNAENKEKACLIVDKIPEHNRNVLLYLINFLKIIADPKNQPVTRMSVNNVAMVFAPNILRCPSENLQVILENTKYEQAFVKTLIEFLDTSAAVGMK